jgi:predicted TPR repeat methyltransferase
VGVDLAENMLELAARKNIYSQLIPLDMLDFLTEQQSSFDLIMAGDVLVYSGDLAMAFAAVQRALRRGGLFVFNTEWGMTENYVLTSAGRFAHSQAYIEQLARHEQLTILASETMVLRQQNTIEVRGGLYLLQK